MNHCLQQLYPRPFIYLATMIIVSLVPMTAFAEEELLPPGIGLYQFGYRSMFPQTHRYNANGKKELLSKPFNQEFSGQNLLSGTGGGDLQRLADHVQRFDSYSQASDSLLNTLHLGQMHGDVRGDVDAKFIGIGYGYSSNLTLMIGIPWVKASVTTSIGFSGANNATEIKQRLGDAAFDELQAGLVEASQINADRIKGSFIENGYEPIEHWDYEGLGDIQIGGVYGTQRRIARTITSRSTWNFMATLPTGYTESPDILTDVNIGKGHFGVENIFRQTFILPSNLWFRAQGLVGVNLPSTLEKRVPEAEEAIVSPDRRAKVDFQPGQDLGFGVGTGTRLGVLRPSYHVNYRKHLRDSYDGSIAGNYGKLSEGSDSTLINHTVSIALQTTELYQQKRFPIPLILTATLQAPLIAYNSTDERYFEITLASFFQTPGAGRTETVERRRKPPHRTKAYAPRRPSRSAPSH